LNTSKLNSKCPVIQEVILNKAATGLKHHREEVILVHPHKAGVILVLHLNPEATQAQLLLQEDTLELLLLKVVDILAEDILDQLLHRHNKEVTNNKEVLDILAADHPLIKPSLDGSVRLIKITLDKSLPQNCRRPSLMAIGAISVKKLVE